MKILLTGANGFVGSHILDTLRSRGLDTIVLLRETSRRRLIEHNLPWAEVRVAAFSEPASLHAALADITHVIHCAGTTRARRVQDFYSGNQLATRQLVQALSKSNVERLVYISSLAAAGPGAPPRPRHETDPAEPVSEYGKSKLAGEAEVKNLSLCEYVVLRPPAVYGPRDAEFLRLFRSVKNHVAPCSAQPLSLVYVKDLARVAVECVGAPGAARRTFFVANPEVLTVSEMGGVIARILNSRVIRLAMPLPLLWTVCLFSEAASRLGGRAAMLGFQKLPELRAPGWVCDPGLIRRDLGLECPTTFREGALETLAWYRNNGWL